MEKINIYENNVRLTIFISNNKLFYINHNNSNIDINKYLNLLIMDESYFNNNGEYCVSYKGDDNKTSKTKKFRFGEALLIATLSAILAFNCYLIQRDYKVIEISSPTVTSYSTNNYDLDYIRNKIYSSTYLSEEEKAYLFNQDFFTDILPIINSNPYLQYKFDSYLTNIGIFGYGSEYKYYDRDNGFYSLDNPSILHIKNYTEIDPVKSDTVAHEFIHLCQDTTGYNLIIEACAEIISNEYYENTSINAYNTQVKLVKTLMEIIGTEPVWIYNFNGDFSLIENEVKPYLSEEDYATFLDCLTFDYDNPDNDKFNKLKEILATLYKAKYNDDIENNKTISLINMEYFSLVRNYFNHRKSESYYLDYTDMVTSTMSLEEAMEYQVVTITAFKYTPISYDDATTMILKPNQSIKRDIVNTNNAIFFGTTTTYNKLYLTCIINGVKYEHADADELVAKGLLEINYSLVDIIKLSAEDYINHNYPEDYEVSVLHSETTIINDDFSVTARVPRKISLPEIKSESYHL